MSFKGDVMSKEQFEKQALIRVLVEALEDAEAGLIFAGADKEPPTGFVPTPTSALRSVRAALAKVKQRTTEAA